MEIELLEQFRDLKISKDKLNELLPLGLKNTTIVKPVEICNNHLIILLEYYQNSKIDKTMLLDWVNTVWFSDLFDYCDENCDSIASVMNELEEIDEEGKELTNQKITYYIHALKSNIEI